MPQKDPVKRKEYERARRARLRELGRTTLPCAVCGGEKPSSSRTCAQCVLRRSDPAMLTLEELVLAQARDMRHAYRVEPQRLGNGADRHRVASIQPFLRQVLSDPWDDPVGDEVIERLSA